MDLLQELAAVGALGRRVEFDGKIEGEAAYVIRCVCVAPQPSSRGHVHRETGLGDIKAEHGLAEGADHQRVQ